MNILNPEFKKEVEEKFKEFIKNSTEKGYLGGTQRLYDAFLEGIDYGLSKIPAPPKGRLIFVSFAWSKINHSLNASWNSGSISGFGQTTIECNELDSIVNENTLDRWVGIIRRNGEYDSVVILNWKDLEA